MKNSNKILLVVVLLLVVLFGVGQFFAFSGLPQGQVTPSPTPSAAPATQIIAYVPVVASTTPTESGSCWTNSIAAAFRTDAWRCAVGNGISDPCFQIPGSSKLLCNIDPTNPNSTSSFVLSLTKPLPAPETQEGNIPQTWGWVVELSNGVRCSPFTGTDPIAQGGIAASFGCAPTTPGGDPLYIFGELNASTSPWTVQVGNLSVPTSSLPVVMNEQTMTIATVWQ